MLVMFFSEKPDFRPIDDVVPVEFLLLDRRGDSLLRDLRHLQPFNAMTPQANGKVIFNE